MRSSQVSLTFGEEHQGLPLVTYCCAHKITWLGLYIQVFPHRKTSQQTQPQPQFSLLVFYPAEADLVPTFFLLSKAASLQVLCPSPSLCLVPHSTRPL